ncbi:hypothetical protein JCM5353_004618 [Sporobolomyces roseus]
MTLGHHNTNTAPVPAGYGAGVPGAVATNQTTTTHSSGGGIASKIPGTNEYKATRAFGFKILRGDLLTFLLESPSDPPHGVQNSTHAGPGAHGATHGPGHTTGTHGTTTTTTGSGGGIASKIPGTTEYKATHPPSHGAHGTATGPGHTAPVVGGHHAGATHGPGHTTTGVTHGAHPTHDAQHAHNVSHSHGLQPGAPGTNTTTTTTTAPKPSITDKVGGKIDVAVGKATKNPTKVVEGEIKQNQGKAGLANSGVGHNTTGTHY